VARKAAHDRQAAAQPGQPWLADYPWQREGISFSAFSEMLRRLVAAIVWNAFLIPFFWIGLNQRGMARVFLVFASLYALIGLFFWVRWAQMLGDLLRYGNSFLESDSFPYFLGDSVGARLRAPRHLECVDELTVRYGASRKSMSTKAKGKTAAHRWSVTSCTKTWRHFSANNWPAPLAPIYPLGRKASDFRTRIQGYKASFFFPSNCLCFSRPKDLGPDRPKVKPLRCPPLK
jgi:hypothetical protein